MKNVCVNYLGDIAVTIVCSSDLSDEHTLENVFDQFNHGSGSEHPLFLKQKLRSLSVNDVVRVGDKWYQCMSVGWKQVTDKYVDDLEQQVVNHPSFKDEGPWCALHQVMWDMKYKGKSL
jgi:hypothetical protein